MTAEALLVAVPSTLTALAAWRAASMARRHAKKTVEQTNGALHEPLERIESKLDRLDGMVYRLDSKVDRLSARVDALEGWVS